MKIGSLFSGMGGLDLAVESVTGAQPAWFVEYDDAPSKILAHHWPDVPNYGDVTKVNWSELPSVDIITGGSPCQDLSAAGKRAGMSEGTRSNLWVNMREAIIHLNPQLVVWENVLGALSATATSDSDMEPGTGLLGDTGGGHLRALGRVLGDLAEIGYDAQWATIRASDIGAPHHRARVFLIAWPSAADSDVAGSQAGHLGTVGHGTEVTGPDGGGEVFPHTTNNRHEWPGETREGWSGLTDGHNRTVEWGDYAPAVRRWERIVGPAPAPTELNRNNKSRLNAAFAEWMMGLPAGWVTEVPALSRAQQLKAIGNGVCPQQATAALTELIGSTL